MLDVAPLDARKELLESWAFHVLARSSRVVDDRDGPEIP
jgi:hypothetical protein